MIRLEPVVLVEGKYDKIKLERLLDATILTTDGFGIFHQGEKLDLLRRLARERGLLLFTDGDGAGFVIRGHLKSLIPEGKLYHAYIPDLYGKEKRKRRPSKEGKLGVEGVPDEVILEAIRNSGAKDCAARPRGDLSKADLYALGLSGGAGSREKREALMAALDLPRQLSPNALLDVLNCITDRAGLEAAVAALNEK